MTLSNILGITLITFIGLGIVINLALLPWYLRKPPQMDNKPKVSLEAFTITGIDMDRFNPMSLDLIIHPNNGSFNSFSLFHNNEIVSNKNCVYDLNKNSYNIQMKLPKDGLQYFEMIGIDSNGNIIYEDFHFWTGFNTLKVRVINEHNQSIIQTPVYLQLIEDDTLQIIEKTDINGEVLFKNIPSKNVRIESSSTDNIYAIKGVIGPTNQIELKLEGFNTNITLIPNNLNVNITNHRGEQTITRTFITKPNTKSVKIYYRFIINGLLNDSIYLLSNDYFRLTLRSKTSLTRKSILYPLDMFMTISEWMELSIPIFNQEDIVQIDITVDTIIKHLFDLNLQIRFTEEVSFGIRNFQLKNTVENSRFLNIHVKNYDRSNHTEIYGSLIIQGNSQLSLKNITLEIIQKNQKITTGQLTPIAYEKLLNKKFESSGILNASDIPLFELINDQINALINMNRTGSVIFRVRVTSNENEEITTDYLTPIKLFIHFIGNKTHTELILPSIQKFLTYQNNFHVMKGCASPDNFFS